MRVIHPSTREHTALASARMRSSTHVILGLLLAAAALKGAACSAVDPNPPNPHVNPEPDPLIAELDGGDGGEETGQ